MQISLQIFSDKIRQPTIIYEGEAFQISMCVARHDCRCKQEYRREATLTRFINIEIGNYTICPQSPMMLGFCSEYAEKWSSKYFVEEIIWHIGHRFNHTMKISSNSVDEGTMRQKSEQDIPCQCLQVRNFKTIERITENLIIMQALNAVDDTLSSGYGCLLHIVLLQRFKASVYLSKISPKHSKALALILAPGIALLCAYALASLSYMM
uniref:Uncharacterized protein n=1 Tax=Glossina pallidipes TaxID=7398 RepID=A0A1A9ZT88_GLOPL